MTLIERARKVASQRPVGDPDGCQCGDCERWRLARLVVTWSEALPGLRREHDAACTSRDRAGYDSDGVTPMHFPCSCGADAHNATLDEIARQMEAEA